MLWESSITVVRVLHITKLSCVPVICQANEELKKNQGKKPNNNNSNNNNIKEHKNTNLKSYLFQETGSS